MTLPASGPLSLNDIQTEFGGTNPIGMNEYYAGGGLVPAGTTGTYGAVPSSGALSVQNFYGTSQFIPIYIEELFQTWLYSGTGATQTITNGINLSGNGGMVWLKSRSTADANGLFDTVRGVSAGYLQSEDTGAQSGSASQFTSFNANGFTLPSSGYWNQSGQNLVSWTFREQPKFFDVVTYTGNGVAGRTVAHNLGSVPGCIIIKKLDAASNWTVYHRSLTSNSYALRLNTTDAEAASINFWNNTTPTSTQFTVGVDAGVNSSGSTFVAYLFAHDAGGFGLTGTDNVISCGSFTTNGSGGVTGGVTLGYEPQWLMVKQTNADDNWYVWDTMRGFSLTSIRGLYPNSSAAEGGGSGAFPTATGFAVNNGTFSASGTFIYVAIRRGPMKVPTTGTSVFQPVAYTGTGSTQSITGASFPPSLVIGITRNSGIGYGSSPAFIDSLRGVGPGGQTRQLFSSSTSSELTTTEVTARTMTGITLGSAAAGNWNFSGSTYVAEMFQRAPGFFDEVCYTGNGPGTQVVNHNLTVVPELVINKVRSTTSGWTVFQGSTTALTGFLRLNDVNGQGGDTLNVSATTITVDSTIGFGMNTSGATYVTYLFATCPGVSKVGRYTGTGTTQVINCGFSAGSRFVMIKRFNSTGPWYVWDSARGIVAGNDPYLLMNSENAEVTGTDYVDTAATGFEISSTAPAEINASGSTFIFLAIA
jgi:hypothetical protein